jgi:hypothetical protein
MCIAAIPFNREKRRAGAPSDCPSKYSYTTHVAMDELSSTEES